MEIAYPHIAQFRTKSLNVLDPRLDSEPLGDCYWKVLHAFVTDTYDTCRYYRDRLERASLSPDKLRSWEDFQAIPPLAPRHVGGVFAPDNLHPASEFDLLPDSYRAMIGEGVSSRTAGDRLVRRFMTTSTTGRPKVSYYTADDWALNCANSWRQHCHISRNLFRSVFNCFHAGHYGGKNVEDTFTRVAGSLVVNRHFSYTTPEQVMSQLCSGLGEMGEFTCLAIPPCNPASGAVTKGVSLHDLLQLDTENYIGKNVRVVTLGGSRADESVYHLRERLWEANRRAGTALAFYVEKYGCSELGMAAAECQHNNGMHLYQGFIYTEILNEKTWMPVRNGERGLVAMTGLRKGSRFLRYLVGDEATFVDEPCPCGRRSPRITDIQRVLDVERLRGGCASATSQRET